MTSESRSSGNGKFSLSPQLVTLICFLILHASTTIYFMGRLTERVGILSDQVKTLAHLDDVANNRAEINTLRLELKELRNLIYSRDP